MEKSNNKMKSQSKAMSGEEIVISGVSGCFPNSDNVLEFCENLYNKVDMVSDKPEWYKHPEVPKHVGKISNMDKFDHLFFKVGYQQAKLLEPISKKILEHAYSAIFDSGNSHVSLKGLKIGVFVGVSFTDHADHFMFDIKNSNGLGTCGSNRSMIANRISYWINSNGPSYNIDFTCASSTAALEKACQSIKSGECDAALVGSGNICSHPMLSRNLKQAGLLCSDGKTRCFDKDANGYVRAEAISLLFIQKARHAKRIYAEIYHVKGRYELHQKAHWSLFRNTENIKIFLNDFYSETDIKPEIIEYIETNGAAIVEADKNELHAIEFIYGNKRSVMVGCVKSNMGNSEAASGLTAITKLCLAYHKGKLPANLHYEQPLSISAIQSGKVQVLTEPTNFNRGCSAINNFSITGANYHMVLKGHYKEKNSENYKSAIPRLVLASARKELGVNKILDSMNNKPVDPEEIALLHNIFKNNIDGHTGRGYTILDTNCENRTVSLAKSVDHFSGIRPPLWFVFSGMGSHWPQMGADLMRIPTFKRAIDKCHKVMEPEGINVIKVLSDPDKTIFDNILNTFAGIAAVQIGLIDILKELGLEPDYIIGHSLGEMGCAYFDNTFTAKEMILAACGRGKAVLDTKLIKGMMAAVGLGYKDLLKCCPPDIDIACHNSSNSTTLSGPVDKMNEFVNKLTQQGIFAKKVATGDVAYHSRYVADAGPASLRILREVIKDPKLRSKKWVSTSVPREHWDSHNAKYSSAEYHTNNFLGPVLFEEMLSLIPPNAVVVEVAPHGLLQAILKRSHPQCTHIPLTRRGCTDGVTFLLEAIGKIYQAGYNPQVDILYPKVEFPVSTETPLLSHLVEWDHSETWPHLKFDGDETISSSSREIIISMHDDEYSYIANYFVNGIRKIPEAALLVYVWKTVALNRGVDFQSLSVMFRDVSFHSDIFVQPETKIKLLIEIKRGTDEFEMSQNNTVVVSGVISVVNKLHLRLSTECSGLLNDGSLNSNDIYTIFCTRGFRYEGILQSIHLMNTNTSSALVKWTNDWVPFLDSLFQFNMFMSNFNGMPKVKFIKKVKISFETQYILSQNDYVLMEKIKTFRARIDNTLGLTRCGGVEIENITYEDQPLQVKRPHVVMDKHFVPFFATEPIEMKAALEIMMQIVAENARSKEIKIVRSTGITESEAFQKLNNIVNALPGFINNIRHITAEEFEITKSGTSSTHVFVYENLFTHSKQINVTTLVNKDDFILTLENEVPQNDSDLKSKFNFLSCMSDGKQLLMLINKPEQNNNTVCIPITAESSFSWIPEIRKKLTTTEKLLLVSENQPNSGLLGFVKQQKLDGYNNISLLAIHDHNAQSFDKENDFFKNQLKKNMLVNILKKGQWGSYYYTSCSSFINLRNFTLKQNVPGNLDELTWVEALPSTNKKLTVQVFYSGLSLKDCYNAANISYGNNTSLGMDFSGVDKNGDRVMGVLPGGTASSSVEADPDLYWPVPDHWTLEDAATVPLPYIHAYYCLVLRGKLKKGGSVLMIGGAGALGQAVISLCLAFGCTVFVTVSTMTKKLLLLRLYPQLQEHIIMYSDSVDLLTTVMIKTKNQGCNLVLNSATGSLREDAMKCVGFWGLFLDLTKYEMLQNTNIGMYYLELDRTYQAVDLSNIFKPMYAKDKLFLHRCLSEGISSGAVTPLTRAVYPPGAATRACRLLAARRHAGRVLLKLRSPTIMSEGLTVSPRLAFCPEDVVVVVCDTSYIGVGLADKLIERGANKILLQMNSSNVSGYIQTLLTSWSKKKASVKLLSENLCTEQGCTNLMKNAIKFGKVKAVFIVLDGEESVIGEKDDFIDAYKKCSVVLNLDMATRTYAEIRYFTIVANINYNARDEYVFAMAERACELRTDLGFPALVVRCLETIEEFPRSQQVLDKMETQSLSTFFNDVEISMKMNYKNVITFNLKYENESFLEKISKILGVYEIGSLEDNSTLVDLNVNEIILNELRAAINTSFLIDYSLEKISKMTVKSLKDLNMIKKKQTTDFRSGLSAFYKTVDSEQSYLMKNPIATMFTATKDITDIKIPHILLIPGFEGRSDIFKTVGENIKILTRAVNLDPDMKGKNIRQIAESVIKHWDWDHLSELGTNSTFNILGYSFGVNIALEIAAILEEKGHCGVVFCLDSSPDAVRLHLDAYLGKLSDNNLQNETLAHVYCLLSGNEDNILKELNKLHSFEEKVEIILKKLKGIVSYSQQYKRHVLKSLYERISLAKEYKPQMKLESELILLKGIAHPASENLTEDYNLSQYTKKPVKVFQLNSDHALCHQDLRVSNIINGHIGLNNKN